MFVRMKNTEIMPRHQHLTALRKSRLEHAGRNRRIHALHVKAGETSRFDLIEAGAGVLSQIGAACSCESRPADRAKSYRFRSPE